MGSCEAPSWKEARDICTKPPVSLGPQGLTADCCPGLALAPVDQGQEASGLLKARALGNNSPVHRIGPQREDECTQHAQKITKITRSKFREKFRKLFLQNRCSFPGPSPHPCSGLGRVFQQPSRAVVLRIDGPGMAPGNAEQKGIPCI